MNIRVETPLEEGVKLYKEKRRYTTNTRAANELIRIGLEREEDEKRLKKMEKET